MYVFLGSAYLNKGMNREATQTFNECLKKAKGPRLADCRQFASRR
jgi:hypothetical protein